MHPDRDTDYLHDILHAAQSIVEFRDDCAKEDFLSDEKLQSAILYQITILGEAVKRLSPPLRTSNPQIAWSEAARMRDRAIHHYTEIDPDIVWAIVTEDIPELIHHLTALIQRLEGGSA